MAEASLVSVKSEANRWARRTASNFPPIGSIAAREPSFRTSVCRHTSSICHVSNACVNISSFASVFAAVRLASRFSHVYPISHASAHIPVQPMATRPSPLLDIPEPRRAGNVACGKTPDCPRRLQPAGPNDVVRVAREPYVPASKRERQGGPRIFPRPRYIVSEATLFSGTRELMNVNRSSGSVASSCKFDFFAA